jgi:hypothetical protein
MYASSSPIVEALPEIQVSEYDYDIPKKGLNVVRLPRVMNPQDNQYVSNQNGILRFRLPCDTPIDFRRSFILVDVTLTTTGGTYKRLSQGAWTIIDRLRHKSNDAIVEERTSYNRIYSMLWQTIQDPTVEQSIGTDLLGLGTQLQRNAWGATTKRYAIPFDLGFIRTGVMPLNAFGNVWHEIEFYLATGASCMETDGTNPSFTISNIDWHVENIVSWDGSYEQGLKEIVLSSRFNVWFQSWTTFQNAVLQTQQDLLVANRYESVNAIVTAFMNVNDLYDPTVDDKFNTFPKNSTAAYQFKINGRLFPEEEIDCTGDALEPYIYYLRAVGAQSFSGFGGDAPNIIQPDFNVDQFLMWGDFRNNQTDVLNNFSTSNNTIDLIFKLRLGAAPAAGTAVNHFINYNTLASVTAVGNVLTRF